MFARIRTWLAQASGLREASRDAAREATREGLTEGFHLGVQDFLDRITGRPAVDIDAQAIGNHAEGNGHPPNGIGTAGASNPIPAAELRGKRKPELITLAGQRGIEADDSWTVPELREALTAEPSAT